MAVLVPLHHLPKIAERQVGPPSCFHMVYEGAATDCCPVLSRAPPCPGTPAPLPTGGMTRTYYLQAEEIEWDYIGRTGLENCA